MNLSAPVAPPPGSQYLAVRLERETVGWLWQDADGLLCFEYAPDWREREGTYAISQSLPLQGTHHRGRLVEAFFANLLPEGDLRVAVANALRVSENNYYGLLEQLGGDCAGALSLHPPQEPLPEGAPKYEPIEPDTLAQWVKGLPQHPLMVGKGDVRLSLAGAQPKLALCQLGETWAKPIAGAISTHILKPPLLHQEGSVENEYFCMTLARACGLNVPDCRIQDSPRAFVVERYDRKRDKLTNKIRRIHQEDFCQALGIPAQNKYEAEGGPSLAQCFQAVRSYCTGIHRTKALNQLRQWVIFNFVIGNHDAHGKNLSLLYADGQVQLAPFYDLLCTAAYPALSEKFAMKIGSAKSPRDYLSLNQWRKMARDCGLNETLFVQALDKNSRKIMKKAEKLAKGDEGKAGPFVPQVISVIRDRAAQIERSLAADKAANGSAPTPPSN